MRSVYFTFRLRPINDGWILVIDAPGLRDEEHFAKTLGPLFEIMQKEENEYGEGRVVK